MKCRVPGFSSRVAFAALFAWSVAAMPPGPAVALTSGTEASPRIQIFANGLRVVVLEDRAAPVVQTAMWYRFGANDERPGKTGLAHALEHMMYSGTRALSQAGLDDVTTRLGSQENAITTNDYTAYTFLVPADKLDLMLRIEADRMQHLSLTDAAWKAEKRTVLGEIDDDLRQPLTKLYDRVCKAASAERVCALAPLGDRNDVARASAEDLRSYYQDWYSPSDATLVITGDVHASDAFASAHAAFDAVPKVQLPPHVGAAPEFEIDRKVEVGGNFPYEVVDLAYAAPGTAEPDSPAYRIVDSVVNNQRSNFYKALVTSGYTLGYSTQLDQNLRGGLYHVFLVVAPGHSSDQVRDAFTGVLASAQSDGFPPELIDAAKTAALRGALYARDSVASLGGRVGYATAVEGLADPASDDARLTAVAPSDVAFVARKYMRTPAVTGVLTPSAGNSGAIPPPPVSAVVDDFSKRPPADHFREAYWIQRAVADAPRLPSRVRPTSFKLANGLLVLVDQVATNPTVFLEGTVASSPAFDQPGKEGEGAMLSTLLAYGGTKYGFDGQRKAADDLGATIDVGQTFEAHGRAQDLPAMLDVIADALERPALAPDRVELVRRQTLEAVSERDFDPDARADHDFEELLYGPSDPAVREPDAASIAAITQRDLRAYARTYLRPDLTTLSITGDVDPAGVRKVLERAFGSWQNVGPTPPAGLPSPPPARAARRYVVSGGRELSARLGEAAPTRANPDFDVLRLIDEFFGAGGTWDTRLTDALRVESDLAYAASSSLDADRYRGTWTFQVTGPPERMQAAVDVVRAQLERLQSDPIGPFELERAKIKTVASEEVAEQSTAVVAARVQRIGQENLPLDYDATLAKRYASIDGAAILRAARIYIHPNDLIEVYEGPHP
jgi:zinc protease